MSPPLLPCGQVQAGVQLLVGSLVSSALLVCVKAMTREHIPDSCWCGAGALTLLTLRTGKEGVRSRWPPTALPRTSRKSGAAGGPAGILHTASDLVRPLTPPPKPDATGKRIWKNEKQQQAAGNRPWGRRKHLTFTINSGAGLSRMVGRTSQGPVQLESLLGSTARRALQGHRYSQKLGFLWAMVAVSKK